MFVRSVMFAVTVFVFTEIVFGQESILMPEPIDIEGRKKNYEDNELKALKDTKVQMKELNKILQQKKKIYGELKDESFVLKGNLNEYIDFRKGYEKAKVEYNDLMECVNSGDVNDCETKKVQKPVHREEEMEQEEKSHDETNRYEQADFREDQVESNQSSYNRLLYTPTTTVVDEKAVQVIGTANDELRSNIDLIMKYKLDDFAKCFKNSRMQDRGILIYELDITSQGFPQGMRIVTESLKDTMLKECITTELFGMQFPSGKYTLRVPLVFKRT